MNTIKKNNLFSSLSCENFLKILTGIYMDFLLVKICISRIFFEKQVPLKEVETNKELEIYYEKIRNIVQFYNEEIKEVVFNQFIEISKFFSNFGKYYPFLVNDIKSFFNNNSLNDYQAVLRLIVEEMSDLRKNIAEDKIFSNLREMKLISTEVQVQLESMIQKISLSDKKESTIKEIKNKIMNLEEDTYSFEKKILESKLLSMQSPITLTMNVSGSHKSHLASVKDELKSFSDYEDFYLMNAKKNLENYYSDYSDIVEVTTLNYKVKTLIFIIENLTKKQHKFVELLEDLKNKVYLLETYIIENKADEEKIENLLILLEKDDHVFKMFSRLADNLVASGAVKVLGRSKSLNDFDVNFLLA